MADALQPKLGPGKLRRALIRMHGDLYSVHRRIPDIWAHASTPLSDLERLVLVLEDKRFFRHPGVDWRAVARETFRALTFRRHGGASTIDMQLVRTATGYRQPTLRRKLYEMLLAVLIQYRYGKLAILRGYLDCAYFGHQPRGASHAARRVFGKEPDQLSLGESAFIAAMLVYPHPKVANEKWRSRVARRSQYGVRVYVANKESFDKLPG